MKKILLILACAILMVGCYDKTTKVSDPNTVLVTLDGGKITKGDVYSVMSHLDPYPAVVTLNLAQKYIFEKEIGLTDAVKTAADAALAKFIAAAGKDIQKALDDAGYKTAEEYYNQVCVTKAQKDILVVAYLTNTFESIVATYKPVKARVIEIKDATKAAAALAEIKNGADFTTVAKKYTSTAYPGVSTIYYSESTLPTEVLKALTDAKLPTLSGVIVSADTGFWYIAQISVTDAAKMKDEIITQFKDNSTFINKALLGFYEEYKFRIYDKTIYDMMAKNYADYIFK